MTKTLDEKVIPPASGKRTSKADFGPNRDGLYGGLPKARHQGAAGPEAREPHPSLDRKTATQNAGRKRG